MPDEERMGDQMAGRGELTEEAWGVIVPLLPRSGGRRGGWWRDHRPVINGILRDPRTGTPWCAWPRAMRNERPTTGQWWPSPPVSSGSNRDA